MKRNVNNFQRTAKAWSSDTPNPKTFIEMRQIIQDFENMYEEPLFVSVFVLDHFYGTRV